MGRDESLSSCLSSAASSLLAATGIERETGPIMRDLLLAGKNMGKGGVGALFGKKRRARLAIGVGGGDSDSRSAGSTCEFGGDWTETHILVVFVDCG